MAFTFAIWGVIVFFIRFSTAFVVTERQAASPSSTSTSATTTATTFYIVDNTPNQVDNGYRADATTGAPNTYFGVGWDGATLFAIDSSTGYLITADPGQTVHSAFIEAGSDGSVQFGTPRDGSDQLLYLSCSIADDVLSCSAEGGYDQFILYGSIANSNDFILRLVPSNTAVEYAYNARLGPQYAAAVPAPIPTRFWLDTNQGWAVYGSDENTPINAGNDYGRNGAISVFSIDNCTNYLTTASPTTSDNPDPMIAFIDGSENGYSEVKMASLPLASNDSIPLTCQIATDGTLVFSCTADTYTVMWLDLGSSTNYDYTLYMGTSDSTGLGSTRELATVHATKCSTCTGS